MKLFDQIDQKKLCNSKTRKTEVTEVTEVTSPESLKKRGYKFEGQEVTKVTRPKSQGKSVNGSLFSYLLDSIQTGGPYARLWPRVRNYCRSHLTDAQWETIEAAYQTRISNTAQQK